MEKLLIEKLGKLVVAKITDESLEHIERIKLLEEEFAELAKDKENVSLVLDFTRVWYISSAVLGKLVLLRNWILAGSGRLKLAGLRRDIVDIFRITKLDSFFDIYPTREEAITAMQTELSVTD